MQILRLEFAFLVQKSKFHIDWMQLSRFNFATLYQQDHMYGYMSTFDGPTSKISFNDQSVVCTTLADCRKYAPIHSVEVQCVEEGSIQVNMTMFLPQSGEKYEFFGVFDCKKLYWLEESGNWAHTFESRRNDRSIK